VADEYNVFSDNVFQINGTNANMFIFCNHQSCDLYGDFGNPTRNHLIERNLFTLVGDSSLGTFVQMRGGNLTIRNNLFDLSGGGVGNLGTLGLQAATEGGTPVNYDNHHYYNNSFIRTGSSLQFSPCALTGGGTGHRCSNNLFYTPGTAANQIMLPSSPNITSSGNMRFGAEYSVNPFALAYPGQGNVTPLHFVPAASSPVVNQGVALGARISDFFGVVRPQGSGWDVGGVELDTTVPGAPSGLRIQ
jgi:hypothetical protein